MKVTVKLVMCSVTDLATHGGTFRFLGNVFLFSECTYGLPVIPLFGQIESGSRVHFVSF